MKKLIALTTLCVFALSTGLHAYGPQPQAEPAESAQPQRKPAKRAQPQRKPAKRAWGWWLQRKWPQRKPAK